MHPPGRIRYHLVVGFSAVLLLLGGVSMYTIYRLAIANKNLDEIVTVRNEKVNAVSVMRNAMRQRQVDLRDMVILPDPFEKDAAWQRYNSAANDFIIARARYISLGLNSDESSGLSALNELVEKSYYLQQNVIDEVMDNQRPEIIYPLLLRAIENQDQAVEHMRKLIDIQRLATSQAAESARHDYRETLWLSLTLGIVALSLGAAIAFMVVRRYELMHRELAMHQEHLKELVEARTHALQQSNKELEAFCYSVSHDLRAPLRGISGFSDAVIEDYDDVLDDTGRGYLNRIKAASQRMGELIDDLLNLSQITRSQMTLRPVDLGNLALQVNAAIQSRNPERRVTLEVAEDIHARGDERLLRIVLENLFDNAWKFTGGVADSIIRFSKSEQQGKTVYSISDNGAGFDMRYVDKLFEVFQRLHGMTEFEGTGIGLVTVRRIIERHGGQVWAEGKPGQGASFHFTLD